MPLNFESIDFSLPQHILVLGAGHFGTALALHLLKHTTHSVTLYDIDSTIIEGINQNHRNPKFLSSVELEPAERLAATTQLTAALLEQHSVLLFIVPTQFLRNSLKSLSSYITKNHLLIFANKGIEVGSTNKFAHEIISEEFGPEISHLATFMAGPSFAVELAQEMPTAVTLAGFDKVRAAAAQKVLSHGRYLRVYTIQDPIGEELCGALKNVIAIASGMVEGLNFGANTRAALVTRGLNEMMLIGTALGCQPLTFMGLCGVGDLLVTCTSEKSRNYSLGEHLGRGESAEEALRLIGSTVEGYYTAKAAFHLAKRLGLSEKTNIINQVYYILYEGKPIKQALEDLLAVVPGEEVLEQAQAQASA